MSKGAGGQRGGKSRRSGGDMVQRLKCRVTVQMGLKRSLDVLMGQTLEAPR